MMALVVVHLLPHGGQTYMFGPSNKGPRTTRLACISGTACRRRRFTSAKRPRRSILLPPYTTSVSHTNTFGLSWVYRSRMPSRPMSGEVDEKMAPMAPAAKRITTASLELVSTASKRKLALCKASDQDRFLLATLSPTPTPSRVRSAAHLATRLSRCEKVISTESTEFSRRAVMATASGEAPSPGLRIFCVKFSFAPTNHVGGGHICSAPMTIREGATLCMIPQKSQQARAKSSVSVTDQA